MSAVKQLYDYRIVYKEVENQRDSKAREDFTSKSKAEKFGKTMFCYKLYRKTKEGSDWWDLVSES